MLPCDPSEWWQQTIDGLIGAGSKHADAGMPDVNPLTAKIQLRAERPAGTRVVTKSVSIGPAEEVSGDCGSGNGSVCTDSYTWSGSRQIHQAQVQKLSRVASKPSATRRDGRSSAHQLGRAAS